MAPLTGWGAIPTTWDFEAWEKRIAADRAARRAEIRNHLAAGKKVRQRGSIWPDCSPFVAEANTPDYLADHLESREYGFAFETILEG